MNVRQLLKCGDSVTTLSSTATTDVVYATNPAPITAPSPVEDDEPVIEEVVAEPDTTLVERELEDSDVNYILKRLMYFGKYVFTGIPMTDSLKGDMVYNIPKSVVEASRQVQEKGLPDFMDPVILMYPIFARDNVGDIYTKYIKKLRSMLVDEGAILDFFGAPESVADPTEDDATDYEPEGEPEDED